MHKKVHTKVCRIRCGFQCYCKAVKLYNTIYPGYANSYLGVNNRIVKRKQEEEKSSQSSSNAENNPQEGRRQPSHSYFPNGEKVAIDYTRSRIGIEQVLTDFRNTANAIGAPDKIRAEVDSYLALIESQSQKGAPNPQIIQANLRSASQILDEYITETLKKPSKVVENWVDALFLQQIDYKAATPHVEENAIEKEISPSILEDEIVEEVSVDDDSQIVEEQLEEVSTSHIPATTSDIYVPQDPQLKRMFVQAKKYAAIDEKERALYSFQNLMEYAEEIGDIQACAMIHFEEARLYDDFDRIEDALYNYDRAAKQSTDNNIKAKSHMYMGKIYDDFVRLDPAIDHYCAAASYAGEADNMKLQTKVLADLAQIHTEKYDRENALMFMGLSDIVVDATGDLRAKGRISSQNARSCEKLGDTARALNYYANSAKSYSSIQDDENLANNYLAAAEIMLTYGNPAKAKKLLGKAYLAAQSTDNFELKQLISTKLAVA